MFYQKPICISMNIFTIQENITFNYSHVLNTLKIIVLLRVLSTCYIMCLGL